MNENPTIETQQAEDDMLTLSNLDGVKILRVSPASDQPQYLAWVHELGMRVSLGQWPYRSPRGEGILPAQAHDSCSQRR